MTKELLEYFNGDDMAASTWKNKYAQEGEETPDAMHLRLAKEFNHIETTYQNEEKHKDKSNLSVYGQKRKDLNLKTIYNLFKDFKKVIPQGSVMSQLGADSIGSLSNCFVVESPMDSYGGIFKTDQELAQLMKRRGGVGTDVSDLRPEGTATSNAAKSSTGAVSFMNRFSETTREVAQNGRRGALMLSMHINHPDSLKFAQIKEDLSKVTGANISIKLNNEFMKAVENDEDYILRFPVDITTKEIIKEVSIEDLEYNKLYDHVGKDSKYIKKVKAKEYWEAIVKAARDVAEPGLLFWDNMTEYSPDGAYPQFKQISTNPCSEIGMQAYDACRLIAVNLFGFVKNPFTKDAYFDFEEFYKVNYESMRLSDDLIDLEISHINRILNKIESDPEPWSVKQAEYDLWTKVKKTATASRRTGLGFTALGDTLASVGLKYDSDEALRMTKSIMRVKKTSELDCTIDLAVLRGSFQGWDVGREFKDQGTNPYYKFIFTEFPEQAHRMMKFGRRNVSFSTVAPTGSLSMLAQVSSGIEPVFSLSYKRRRKVNPNDKNAKITFVDDNGDSWEEFNVVHHKLKDWFIIAAQSEHVPELALKALARATPEELEKIIAESPYAGATAPEIDWERRVKLQGIIQKYITHSISSTINLPEDVSVEEVSKIYKAAWKEGLKGITVYRDGSRSGVLVSNDKKEEEITKFHENHAPTRPKYLDAKLVRFNNNKEKWIAFVGFLDGKPYEIFTGSLESIKIPTKIEEGQIAKVKDENGVKRYDFVHEEGTVEGINKAFNDDYWNYAKMISSTLRHGMPLHFAVEMVKGLNFPEDHINTWKNGVGRALKKFIPDGKVEGMKCNDCESTNVIFEEGCSRCLDCGSSKCG